MDTQTPAPNPIPPTENIPPQNPVAETPPPPPSPKKPFLTGKIILLILLLILFGTGGTYLALNSKPKPQACTLEAKICPDGTSVGRTGPNCTFAICPTKPTPLPTETSAKVGTPDETATWKTYTNIKNNYSFSYPSSWIALSPGGQYGDKCIETTDKDSIIELTQKTLDYCGFVGDQLPNSEAEFTIWVSDKPWKDEEILTTDATGKDISKDIVVANEKATKTPFTEKSEYPNAQATRIYFNHNNKGFLLFLKQTDKKGAYDPLYDQILSTFKFTQ